MSWSDNGDWEEKSTGNKIPVYFSELIKALHERLDIVSGNTFVSDAEYPTPVGFVQELEPEDLELGYIEGSVPSPHYLPNLLSELQNEVWVNLALFGDPGGKSWTLDGTDTHIIRWMETSESDSVAYTTIEQLLAAAGFGDAWLSFDPSAADVRPLLQMKAVMDLLIYPEWNFTLRKADTTTHIIKVNHNGMEAHRTDLVSVDQPGGPGTPATVEFPTDWPFTEDYEEIAHIWDSSDESTGTFERIFTPIGPPTYTHIFRPVGDASGWDTYHRYKVPVVREKIINVVLGGATTRLDFDSAHPFEVGDYIFLWAITRGAQHRAFSKVLIIESSTAISVLPIDTLIIPPGLYREREDITWQDTWDAKVSSTPHTNVAITDIAEMIDGAFSAAPSVDGFAGVFLSLNSFGSSFFVENDHVALFWTLSEQYREFRTDMIQGDGLRSTQVYRVDLRLQRPHPSEELGFDLVSGYPTVVFKDSLPQNTLITLNSHSNPVTEVTEVDRDPAIWPKKNGLNTPGCQIGLQNPDILPWDYESSTEIPPSVSTYLICFPLVVNYGGSLGGDIAIYADAGTGCRTYTDIKSILTYITP